MNKSYFQNSCFNDLFSNTLCVQFLVYESNAICKQWSPSIPHSLGRATVCAPKMDHVQKCWHSYEGFQTWFYHNELGETYLSWSVSGVPQGVPQMLAWPCGGVNHFDWQPWVTLCLGRWAGPVGLCDLLPHDHVEARARLVSENEAGIVIIPIRVDEESSTEVNWIELIKTFKEIRKKVRIYVIICILNWLAIHVFFLISFF